MHSASCHCQALADIDIDLLTTSAVTVHFVLLKKGYKRNVQVPMETCGDHVGLSPVLIVIFVVVVSVVVAVVSVVSIVAI